jgi:hypothetical protein
LKETKCFAFVDGECLALNGNRCFGKCAFYKTREKAELGRAAAFARLAGLPEPTQYIISENYYGGFYPWRVR